MNKQSTQRLLIILLSGIFFKANAQQWLGRTTGNYAGTYGTYYNASSIADSKYRFYFNLWGRGVNLYNNYLSYNAPLKLNHWSGNNISSNQYRDANGNVMIGDDWFNENLNGKNKYFSYNQDIWGPAFMFPVSRNWNMSINTRQRSGIQYYGISEEAARMAKNGIGNNQYASINNKFSANIQSYQELSFTLGGIMAQNKHHKLNGGATLKFIRGLGAAYFRGDRLNISGTGTNSANINGNFQYAYTDDKSAVAPLTDPYGLFSLQSRGFGAGVDLGLTYTYRSKAGKYKSKWYCDANAKRSDYDFKLSMAFNDLGGIRFGDNSKKYSYNSEFNSAVSAGSDVLNGFNNARENGFDTIGRTIFAGLPGVSSANSFSTALPAAFNLQMDFRLNRNLFTAIYWNQSLKSNMNTGLRSTSMLSVIPRYESGVFEFSMPLTLSENYRNFYLGAYTRIGPFFFGSDNLAGLLNLASNTEFRGADIYGGVSFGIGHCAAEWYEEKVDPVYMDTLQNDTLKTELRDTVKTLKRDTVIKTDTVKIIKRDTVFINKPVERTTDQTRENEIKRREAELNRKKAELDAREKAILDREKKPLSDNVALNECNTRKTALESENINLRNRVNTQAEEILRLKNRVDELNTLKTSAELENKKCSEDKIKTNAEIIRLQEDILKANRKISELETEVNILRKPGGSSSKPSEPVMTDAIRLQRANRQIDSLKLIVLGLQTDLDKCKKNSAETNAEVLKMSESVKKAGADKAKAENDARVARYRADSLALILKTRTAELEACKTSVPVKLESSEMLKKAEADKAKAENDARVARYRADSLELVLKRKTEDLENCRKNSTQNDAAIQKLNNCENENTLLKSEIKEMSKTINTLNTKNYALSNQVDSLVNALKNCCKNCSTQTNTDAEVLKKCQDGKALLEAEVLRLKSVIGARDKSLDSMELLLAEQSKKQVELNAQISKLNTELNTLKSSTSDCSEIQKQLNDKNAELNKVKLENGTLQNQVKTLNQQLNEYKNEYSYMLKESQKCKLQLDSCMRGLYNVKPPQEPKEGGEGSGPNEGSMERQGQDDVYSNTGGQRLGQKIGSTLLNVLINSGSGGNTGGSGSSNSGSSGSGSGSKGSTVQKRPTENTGGGGSNSGGSTVRRPSAGSGTNTGNTTVNRNTGSAGSGNTGSGGVGTGDVKTTGSAGSGAGEARDAGANNR